MSLYKGNIKISGIGGGFSPENAGMTGEVLTKTSTGYEWDSIIDDSSYGSSWDGDTTHAPTKNAISDKVESIETEIATKADADDVYNKTEIDNKVTQLEEEIESAGGSSGFGKTATVGLFANASGGNFGLMNNTNQYSTNSTYNSNRADNTQTGDGELNISIISPSFWTTLKGVNRYNAYYNISGLTPTSTKAVASNGYISSQVKTNIIPLYGTNTNYTVYQYNIDISGSGAQRGTISIASIDESGTHLTETVTLNPDGDAKSYQNYGLWARKVSNRNTNCAYFCLNTAGDSVERYAWDEYVDTGTGGFDPFAVGGDGRYIYFITTTMTANSSTMYGGGTLCLRVFDTSTKTATDIWDVGARTNYQRYKKYEAGNLARIYFYKYWKIGSGDKESENYGYVEFNKDTAVITGTGSMTYDEVNAFMDSHAIGEYDNFNDWNLLVNLENTTDGYAYFGGEKVGKGSFSRGWDNAKKEYWYANNDLVEYTSNDGYIKLEVGGQVVEKWEYDNHGWGIIPSIGTVKSYYGDTYISTNTPTIALKAKGLGSTGSIVLQPTKNNLQDVSMLNMWSISNATTSTWLELDIDGYQYKGEADILIASNGVNSGVALNINGDITKYARVLLLRAEDGNNHYWDSFEFVPKYMPTGDYKINLRYEDYYQARYYSTISSDRKSLTSNFTTTGIIMLGYK